MVHATASDGILETVTNSAANSGWAADVFQP